jgi:amidase
LNLDHPEFACATDLIVALNERGISSVELTNAAIARIERLDDRINAICVRDFERAVAAASEADTARAQGSKAPLLGIPVTIKDSFNVAGMPTTWGIPAFKAFSPSEDAVAVARLKAAGAVVLGKTNVPFALGDLQSYNDIYGTTNNPWDLTRTPGGSSGGSAAALAAGYGALSLGSDIGGSLRAPASFCGVYAHKPTFGLLPSRGHTPPSAPALPIDRDLTVIGPMARSPGDLEYEAPSTDSPNSSRPLVSRSQGKARSCRTRSTPLGSTCDCCIRFWPPIGRPRSTSTFDCWRPALRVPVFPSGCRSSAPCMAI